MFRALKPTSIGEDSVLENLFTPDCEKVDLGNQSDYSSESEFENFTMAPKLDLGVALKLVDKFSGDADKKTIFLIGGSADALLMHLQEQNIFLI